MRVIRRIIVIAVVGLSAVAIAAAGDNTREAGGRAAGGGGSAGMSAAISNLKSIYPSKELEEGVYVGSEFCMACHQGYEGWKHTKHAQSLRQPMEQYSLIRGEGVSCDYDRNGIDDFIQGLDFNQISSAFDPYKPNAPILSVVDGTYTVTIGEVSMPVVFINGGVGAWRERYAVRIPVTDSPTGYSDDVYFPPIQYDDAPHRWIPYKATAWWTPDFQPKVHPGMTRAEVGSTVMTTFTKNCIGCHTTGIRHLGKTAEGEWQFTPYVATLYQADDPHYFDYDGDGNKDLVNIGCEMCHGPGSEHILGGGDPSKIVNPAKLDPDQANEICGRCHNRQRSVPNHTFGWPYHDDTDSQWTPGTEPMSDYYVNANELWPDEETSYEHNQHYAEMYRSAHETNPYEKLRCFDCHELHEQTTGHQIIPEVESDGVTIPTRNDNDTLCLSCHATHGDFEAISKEMVGNYDANVGQIGATVSAHTHHPYAPERSMGLSRCSECHMPSVANAQRASDHRAHTMFVVPPQKTLIYQGETEGMPNACGVSCHSQKVNLWGLGIDDDLQTWNDPFEIGTATILQQYYGPNGSWWVHDAEDDEP